MLSDPLEGLEQRPIESQVAVLANEMRNQRNALSDVKKELQYVKRALWGVVFTVIGGMLLFLFSVAFNIISPKSTAVLHYLAGLL
jgi:amino acid transporter